MATLLILIALSGWALAVAELSDAGPLSGRAAASGPPPTVSLPLRPPTTPTSTPRPTLTPAPTPTLSVVDPAEDTSADAPETPTPEETPTSLPSPTASPTPAPTSTPHPSPTPVRPFVEHVVEPGESLSALASAFGVSAGAIAAANHLSPDAALLAGQRLFIPRVAGVIHTVHEGESVSGIAELYGVSPAAIAETNNLTDAGLIFVGQRLLVPGARPVTPSPVPPTPTPSPSPTATRPAATATPVPTATRAPTLGSATATVNPRPTGYAGPNAPLRWPAAGGLSQLFGSAHTGIDIMAEAGDPVLAAGDGLVVLVVDSDFGYGKRIEIDHGGGLSTLYAHLSAFSVAAGQRVSAGQRVGAVGDTGYAFGPHLHFEVRLNGSPVDPLRYLP